MKKALRILAKIGKILLVILLVAYGAAYWYISSHKKELIQQFSETVSDKIDGKVDLGEADITFFSSFPRIAIRAKNLMVTDSLYKVHQHAFFSAKDLFVSINIFKLVAKEPALTGLKLKSGSIYFYTDTSGYTNSYLLKSKKEPTGGPKKTDQTVSIKNIELDDVHFILNDEKREKLHDIVVTSMDVGISDEGDWLNLQVQADLQVNGLAFNLPNGTFLKDTELDGNFLLRYEKLSQKLSFKDIELELNDQDFTLTGNFDLGEKNPQFDLSILNENTNQESVKQILPQRIAKSISKVTVGDEFVSRAVLKGPLKGGEPLINASWDIKDADMKTIFMDFESVTCTGYYTNEVVKGMPRKDPNSKIVINNFLGEWHSIPVKASRIEILDLKNPILTCDLHSNFEIKKLDDLLGSQSLSLSKGTANVNLNYSGPVEYNSETFAKLDGSMQFANASMNYRPRNINIDNVNGTIAFKNTNVFIQNLGFNVMSNKIVMNAEALGLVSLLNDDPNKVKIDYRIYSPKLNLNEFLFLFKSREDIKQRAGGTAKFSAFSGKLDGILDRSRIDLHVNADQVVYKKFAGSNFNSDISILQDQYLLNDVSMAALGGSMKINGSIKGAGSNRHIVTLRSDVNSVNVKQLLFAFDNFGQDGITDKELAGLFSADVNVALQMNSDGVIQPSSANGEVSFSLKNGQLINFEPLKKIQKFVFKNRDFDQVDFAELKDKFTIRNGEVKINRMEIQSSVLSLFVEGLYSTKGKTDLSIQVPLNNLKKREDDYIPENIGTDQKGGRSIFLRGQTGADGKVQIKLDLFKKYYKKDGGGQDVQTITDSSTLIPATSKPARKKGILKNFRKGKKNQS